jgi:hypothetical protein
MPSRMALTRVVIGLQVLAQQAAVVTKYYRGDTGVLAAVATRPQQPDDRRDADYAEDDRPAAVILRMSDGHRMTKETTGCETREQDGRSSRGCPAATIPPLACAETSRSIGGLQRAPRPLPAAPAGLSRPTTGAASRSRSGGLQSL